MGARRLILRAAIRERLTHDLGVFKAPVAFGILTAARLLLALPSVRAKARGFRLLMKLHSGALSESADRQIARRIARAKDIESTGRPTGLYAVYNGTIDLAVRQFRASANPDPRRLLGSHVCVVKSARPDERGVIVVDYSNNFAPFLGLFDVNTIARNYTIVLEPSWAGTCTPEILAYGRLAQRVYVQTIEPRDKEFLGSLALNLRTVPLAANWWVDPRIAAAAPAERDIDVIMVAAWSDIKRHWRVLKALSGLRARGHRLRTVLVGYKYDRTRADIEALARHYGVADQVEIVESIPQEEVRALLLRLKLHVLWSRRECANRAIVEAMMADVPVIVREGMTFGFAYPYINAKTGRFVAENKLGDAIVDMLATREMFAPREWALDNMTCEKANAILEDYLRNSAETAGKVWSSGIAVKTSTLYGQRYFNAADRDRFKPDYDFLESTVLPDPMPFDALWFYRLAEACFRDCAEGTPGRPSQPGSESGRDT